VSADVQALVSVRSVDEALLAADAGVPLIDCKEPRAGALGALPLQTVAAVVHALRTRAHRVEISATIGDAPRQPVADAARLFAAGVDVVKIGVASRAALPTPARPRIVPVLIADRGIDDALLDAALDMFDTVMLDTADKSRGSLLDLVARPRLQRIVERARQRGRRIGLAGALRRSELATVRALQADFAGFRSAVCGDGDRCGTLDRQRLERLLDALDSRQRRPMSDAPA
jgi:uncharacterized protein (UPF0264 family)